MTIQYDEFNQIFHLSTDHTSYVLQIVRDGYLAHRYWGKRINAFRDSRPIVFMGRPLAPDPDKDWIFSLDLLPQEYPGFGTGDFRTPAYQIKQEDGSTTCDLRFHSYRIVQGKPKLEGLPATYTEHDKEAQTLIIELKDTLLNVKVILSYTVFDSWNAITRSVQFVNLDEQRVSLLHAASMSMDFDHAEFDMLHLSGAWANERNAYRRPLFHGKQSIDSNRGASSPYHNPFLALLNKNAGEQQGEVYGFNLVYSGNFSANIEVDAYETTRVTMGINSFDFSWLLEPGEAFQAPEVVMVYSDEGIGGMSRIYHDLYRSRLCRGEYRDKIRPVLINNWEGTYFDFTADKIEQIASKGAELGIELFVLDDGWFGKRNDDKSSLGDWFVNQAKLPGGLEQLVERINKLGMQFGLWFEPEMVSEDSELYRAHPDWCIHVNNRRRTTSRHQLVLDFSRKEVCDAIVAQMSSILGSVPITYVKWDMNRHMTEIGSAGLPAERQRETAHRYMLGVYDVMERLTAAFPQILFESCSSGGGRFDPGILYYMPQTWASDNTDATCRLKIQYGTSIVYPVSTIGAHVSAVPSFMVERMTSLETRGNAAFFGAFGYELDLTHFTEQEMQMAKAQVELFKEIRELVQFGDLYRLLSPFEGNDAAWMMVAKDKSEAIAFYFHILARPNSGFRAVRLQGLDPHAEYALMENNEVYGADELMSVGLRVPANITRKDFTSYVWRFQKVKGDS
jgi:alpha-galactosidase